MIIKLRPHHIYLFWREYKLKNPEGVSVRNMLQIRIGHALLLDSMKEGFEQVNEAIREITGEKNIIVPMSNYDLRTRRRTFEIFNYILDKKPEIQVVGNIDSICKDESTSDICSKMSEENKCYLVETKIAEAYGLEIEKKYPFDEFISTLSKKTIDGLLPDYRKMPEHIKPRC